MHVNSPAWANENQLKCEKARWASSDKYSCKPAAACVAGLLQVVIRVKGCLSPHLIMLLSDCSCGTYKRHHLEFQLFINTLWKDWRNVLPVNCHIEKSPQKYCVSVFLRLLHYYEKGWLLIWLALSVSWCHNLLFWLDTEYYDETLLPFI